MHELAAGLLSFITIVNPVRISRYTDDSLSSLRAQYSVIRQYHLPATWLLTYDVLTRPDLTRLLKNLDPKQELGIFLEVTPTFAEAAGVIYHQSGSWHFANSVFLSGYTQEERVKLITAIFDKFESQFGYHPVSVGSWWTDSFSLDYMAKKYGITANLTVADQYATDNYQIWGQYWSTPFYPSKLHAGIPSATPENKINVVNLQWAARHPTLGYTSSLYSTQDYFTTPQKLDTNFFADLVNLYTDPGPNEFGHIVVGLEADLSPQAYSGEFASQLAVVSKSASVKTTMSDFSAWYRQKFPTVSPPRTITDGQTVWYQSPHYRIGFDQKARKIIDLRLYPQNYQEPYYLWPNSDISLHSYIPSAIDSRQNPSEAIQLSRDSAIEYFSNYFQVTGSKLPRFSSPYLKTKTSQGKLVVFPVSSWPTDPPGHTFRDWSPEAKHLLASPKQLIQAAINRNLKLQKETYFISQAEIEGLNRLKSLPSGKVIVPNEECLQCPWFGPFRPAVFANSRNYVAKISRKTLIQLPILTTPDRPSAQKLIRSSGARYIYLVSYGQYPEKLKFSPGDYPLELLFENSHVQIWQVRK